MAGLLQRLVYYACTMYVNQLKSGGSYAYLRSAISICLLDKNLFRDDTIAHHRFRLADPEHGMEVPDSIEVHTVELTKYNLQEGRQEGREEGELLGKIRILQELLGEEPSSPESLDERTIGELSEILADLQQRLRSRES